MSVTTIQSFDGLIDEVRIYERALSADEVRVHYAASRSCRGDCDCDGRVDFSDIDYFAAALPDNPCGWASLYQSRHAGATPLCSFASCDINGDGHVGFTDIDPFVALIPSTCP